MLQVLRSASRAILRCVPRGLVGPILSVFLILLGSAKSGVAAPQSDEERPGYVPTAAEEQLPNELRRQVVFFRTTETPGTIIVHTQERFLYLVQPNNRAFRYGIGVGREGFQWVGLKRIDRK